MLSIFDPRKATTADLSDLSRYGEEATSTLLAHYGVEKPTDTMLGKPTIREAVITSDVTTEWKMYHQLILNKPKSNMGMLKTMFPNLTICLSISVATASVERNFSQLELIKTHLRGSLNEKRLSCLMKIAIESPAELAVSWKKLSTYGKERVEEQQLRW